ncbi:MAG: bifunctional glutamate N-acetyltransferase/amino-acid acetyltransferase ArgJ [Puniceicoccaceae bacterium]
MGDFVISESSNGCVDTPGFKAAGVHCDVRGKSDDRLDLALVLSDTPCTVAGVFTRNRMAAAPVRLDRELIEQGKLARGFVANSGNANACTGHGGMTDAIDMQEATAIACGCDPQEIFICSTGRIGKRLPMPGILDGIQAAAAGASSVAADGLNAADAILTSDTRRKVCSIEVKTASGTVHLSGMAKGAGMIEPNMATMLGFICTDAVVKGPDLQAALGKAVAGSFNAITVDGDESTNDTVLVFANGVSGIEMNPQSPDWDTFQSALGAICEDLARKIVGDGEKITKVVEIRIEGAVDDAQAKLAARAIGNSLLVKSSWYGNDPNWGRVMDAVGYSGADLEEESVQMWYADDQGSLQVPAFRKSVVHEENLEQWKQIVAADKFRIIVDLGKGTGASRIWSTDLTEGYVDFNKSE